MRTISAALLAQATKHGSRPFIQASLADNRFRWTSLHTGDGAQYYTAQCLLGTTIWRVRVTSAGAVQTATVTSPTTQAQWITWTTRATGAIASSDCAICSPATNGLRVFFTTTGAVTGYDLKVIESTDGGTTWGSATTIKASIVDDPPFIAATSTMCFFSNYHAVGVVEKPWSSGSWTEKAWWASLPSVTTFYGLAAGYLTSTVTYVLAACDGRIYFTTFNLTAETWASPSQIAPGGQAAPASALTMRYPSIHAISSAHLIATWLEHYDDGANTWYNTVACQSRDAAHWGEDVTLYVWGDTELRTALCYLSTTRILYAANEKCACTHKAYDASDTTQNLSALAPAEYRRDTDGNRSHIVLVITNIGETYNPIGQSSTLPECVKPHTQVLISRGYYTTGSSHEEEPTEPHFITQATIRTTPDQQALVLECVNGWGLLDKWRPTETLTYSGQTIRWLLAEMCAKAGLQYTDSSESDLGRTLSTFTMRPEISAAEACRQLLRLAGATCYWNESGQMYALCLANYAPVSHLDITEANILEGTFTSRANTLTSQSTFGNTHATNLNLGQQSMSLGMRIHQIYTDYRLTSLEHAQDVQACLWDMGRRTGRNESITIPLRPDAEIWDTVHLSIDPTIIPSSDSLRTIAEIHETYHRQRNRYTTTLQLIDQ
jgi:hypothetical protein